VSPSHTFTKRDPSAPAGFFEAEARGLRWLAETRGGVPVVTVLSVDGSQIVLERLIPAAPTREHAREFGHRLAATHAAGSPVWGRDDSDGFIGPLPLANGPYTSFVDLWWAGRIEPHLRRCVDRGLLPTTDARAIESVVGTHGPLVPAARPSRLHGDLWSGNVVWTATGAVLVDGGAAHGGHSEADLAMLALFGMPYLSEALDAYNDVSRLQPGRDERVPFFWLHPLLVHVELFGGGYVGQTRRAVGALA
jgi:fructosamine-3-kinase